MTGVEPALIAWQAIVQPKTLHSRIAPKLPQISGLLYSHSAIPLPGTWLFSGAGGMITISTVL